MKSVVVTLELRTRDVRVDLSGRDVGVAEHLLDATDVGVVLDEMCCK